MIKLFKQNSIAQALVIMLVVIVLWARAFVSPVGMPPSNCMAPLYELLYQCLNGVPRVASALALLLVLGQGAWINRLLSGHKITKAHSLLPMLLYVTLMGCNHNDLTITPLLLVNIFLLAATSQLLSDGSTQLSTERNFNASFCIGMMGICYLPALYYIVPFIFVFIIYKMYRWRNIVVAVLGLIAPFIILFTYAFLCDKLDYCIILMEHDLTQLHLDRNAANLAHMLPSIVLLILLLSALLHLLGSINDRTVHQRINIGVLSLPLMASAILFFYPHPTLIATQSIAMPFAFIGTRFFLSERKRKWISETLIWIFLISALLNRIISN